MTPPDLCLGNNDTVKAMQKKKKTDQGNSAKGPGIERDSVPKSK